MRELDPELEAAFKAECHEVEHSAMYELRRTLQKGYNPKDGGYGETIEEARFNIINQCDKQLNRMATAHLKKANR